MMRLLAIFEKNIAAAFISIGIVAPLLWMAMDREVPYVRTNGQIVPNNPKQGDAVEVVWRVTPKKTCPVASRESVKRWIVNDRTGRVVSFEDFAGHIGSDKSELNRTEIRRNFVIPEGIDIGPSTYHSEACFACNPTHKIKPVCVTTPDIQFEIRSKDDGQ